MKIRYTRHGQTIRRIIKVPYSYETRDCRRVPRPVREAFAGMSIGGFQEVIFDTKTRTVSVVPFYEQIQGR